MKIGIYDPYLNDLGGGEKYMMKIAECLSRQNNVSVFWDNKEDIDKLLDRFSLDLSRISIKQNIFSPKISFLSRVIESKNYEAIFFLSDGSIPFVLSKKLFIHIQQPIKGLSSSLKSKIKIKRVNRFFCNSYYSKSYVDRALGIESTVLYPPIEIKVKETKKENIILHVGRLRIKDNLTGLDDYKKQNFMIGVFKEMVKRGLKDWRFVLAISVNRNDDKKLEKNRKMAKGFPVSFEVNKSNNKLWDLYSKAKIYWHASGFGEDLEKYPEYAEHFGISTVEAMGAGAVPVVINAGGQKEIVSDEEDGFLWETEEEFIEKTKKLMSDENLWQKMSKKSKEKAFKFAGSDFCSNLKKIIE